MVTPLQRFNKDPNNMGRGAGIYYHRGHGIYSLYNAERDILIKAKGYDVHKIGLPNFNSYLQTGDGKIMYGQQTSNKKRPKERVFY